MIVSRLVNIRSISRDFDDVVSGIIWTLLL
jgi:hypothetical protein